MVTVNISLSLAIIAGLGSFLSPCVFSLIPAYIGYLGSRSTVSSENNQLNRFLTFTHGLAFVLGFSIVFIMMGAAASALGSLLFNMRIWLSRIGGLIIVIFGLQMIGLLRIPFLEYDLRPRSIPDRRLGYVSSVLMGVFFSAGWSPCLGYVLGPILTIAGIESSLPKGVMLLTAYSAGLAIPFLIATTQINLVTTVIRRYGKVMHYVEIAMGVVMIIVGVLLLLGKYALIANLGASFFPAFDEVIVGRYLLFSLIAAALIGLLPAYIAKQKGRDFYNWWFFGASLFIIALPLALKLKPTGPQPDQVSDIKVNS